MSRNKDKPIDRYPYMDNDLKGWANEFVRVETYATGFRYLDDKIDNIIVGTDFVTHDEFDTYTEATGETLNSLQEQIDAIDVSNYVDKDTYNTDKAQTDETLENLQEQIDAIDVSGFATKTELNEYETTTDGRLDTIETTLEGIPTTYATKSELSECCEEVGERLDSLETTVEDIPNTYATKTDLTEYETTTNETLENLQEQIDAIDLSDFVTDDELATILDENCVDKTTYNTDKTQTDERLDALETIAEGIPTTYATKSELSEYETTTDETLESLQDQIDAIDVSAYVEKSTYNTDKTQTDEILESLQDQIDAIDTSAYVEKTTYNTDKAQTDETLTDLQEQIDDIDVSAYVEKSTYNTDKAQTDETLENLQEQIDAIDTSAYATKSELSEYETATDETLESLQDQIDAIDTSSYATKLELSEYETATDETLESLQDQIDAIDTSSYATKLELSEYETATDETLESLQDQIDAIDVSAYVEKSTYNTDKAQTDETLTDLQDQIDAIDVSAYATKTELTEYETATDGRLDTLETITEDIPTTYATKSELSECCEEVEERLDTLETTVEDIPNTYATKTELTEYETATDAALDEIREEIENLDNYDPATDTVLGVVKTNSAEGITLNDDDQLEVSGRLGQFPDGGLYYPTDAQPVAVGNYSILMTDALGLSIQSRCLYIAGGQNLTLRNNHAAGTTEYHVANNYANRIAAAPYVGVGCMASLNVNTAHDYTVPVLSVKFANGDDVTPYTGDTEPDNDIIITLAETVNPDAATRTIRLYGTAASSDTISCGQGNAAYNGKVLQVGQALSTTANQVIQVGNANYSNAANSAQFGRQNINKQTDSLLAGYGHNNTDGRQGSSGLGLWSVIESDTLLAIGNGTSDLARSNALEVKEDGSLIINNTINVNEALSDLGTQVAGVEDDITNLQLTDTTMRTDLNSMSDDVDNLDTRVTALEQGGISLSDYMGYHYYKANSDSSYYIFEFEITPILSSGLSIILNNSCVNVMFRLAIGRNLLPNTTYTLGHFNEWTGISSLQQVTVPVITSNGKLIYLTIGSGLSQVTLTVGSDEIQANEDIVGTISFANEYPLKTVDENLANYRQY